MNEISYVVVFPTIFSKNKIPQLISNIKKILKIKDQQFKSIKRDGDVILIDANDPVFASSAINLLFGIEKIIIARQIKNNFKDIVSEITSTSGNLLLKGERFLVKVEGISRGFLVKDVEIAATSNIIEKKSNLGAHPGTDENFDKLLYTFLTKTMHTFLFFQTMEIMEYHINHKTKKLFVQCMMNYQLYHVMRQSNKVMIQKLLFVIDKNLNY